MSAADVSRVRGVGAEEDLDYTRAERRHIRRRSFRLLGELARPVRGTLLLTVVFVLVSNAARAAGPLIIAWAIDAELPRVVEAVRAG
ncbi:ABC transporter ATP-binding protein, partial [Escherichia coli]|nr:ABC transporter ATP-binding protein [Escherichia coli]